VFLFQAVDQVRELQGLPLKEGKQIDLFILVVQGCGGCEIAMDALCRGPRIVIDAVFPYVGNKLLQGFTLPEHPLMAGAQQCQWLREIGGFGTPHFFYHSIRQLNL